MAEGHIQIQVEESRNPHEITPLLKNLDGALQLNPPDVRENDKETLLDKTLQRLEFFLSLLGFNQSSIRNCLVSWGVFLVMGVLLPVVMLQLSNCPGCEKGQIKSFEIGIVVSQASLATSALICLSHNLRKYGVRKFLFVDRYSGHVERFSGQYVQKISVSNTSSYLIYISAPYITTVMFVYLKFHVFVEDWKCKDSVRLLMLWVMPCCLLKTIREVIRMMYVHHESWWQSAAILIAFVLSWTYMITIILSACVLFHLVCNLQIIHFDDYGKLLEREPDVVLLLQEHARLRFCLSKISHRFRIYLLLQFVIVTVSQFMFLFQVTGYNGMITIINGGDFALSTIVQVAVIILCLNGASKISHRAQGIGAIANRWHALITCSASDVYQLRTSNSVGNLEAANKLGMFHVDYSESDLESLDFVSSPSNVQLATYMSSYHKRLALVMYLQSNPGGITIFGWTVDRGLLNTIFFIELSLVTFVLGKTIVDTSE